VRINGRVRREFAIPALPLRAAMLEPAIEQSDLPASFCECPPVQQKLL
jgi:hypothetical protein